MTLNKKEAFRALKFFLFSISAGVIQFGLTTILNLTWPEDKFQMGPMLFYLIGLIASVIYNTTINRKFTFKSAANFPVALAKTIGFYIVFAPLSCLFEAWLTTGNIFNIWTIPHLNWNPILATFICMVINLLTEWPFQRFFVFRNSIDTNQQNSKTKENTVE